MITDKAEQAAEVLNRALHRAQREIITGAYEALRILGGDQTDNRAVAGLMVAIRRHLTRDGEKEAIQVMDSDADQREAAEAALRNALASASRLANRAEMRALEMLIPGLAKLPRGAAVPRVAEDMLRDLQTIMADRMASRPGRLPKQLEAWEVAALAERAMGRCVDS